MSLALRNRAESFGSEDEDEVEVEDAELVVPELQKTEDDAEKAELVVKEKKKSQVVTTLAAEELFDEKKGLKAVVPALAGFKSRGEKFVVEDLEIMLRKFQAWEQKMAPHLSLGEVVRFMDRSTSKLKKSDVASYVQEMRHAIYQSKFRQDEPADDSVPSEDTDEGTESERATGQEGNKTGLENVQDRIRRNKEAALARKKQLLQESQGSPISPKPVESNSDDEENELDFDSKTPSSYPGTDITELPKERPMKKKMKKRKVASDNEDHSSESEDEENHQRNKSTPNESGKANPKRFTEKKGKRVLDSESEDKDSSSSPNLTGSAKKTKRVIDSDSEEENEML